MSSIYVNLFDVNPDLIEVTPPYVKKGYKRSDIKYEGKNLVLDVPKVKSSGVFWTKPDNPNDYPKPEVRISWDNSKFANATAIQKAYDVVYCAIFRKLAPYGELFSQGMMTAHAKHCYPEKLDEESEVLKMMGMPAKKNREVFRDILKNFYDNPKVSKEASPDDRSVRDFTKPMESWFYLRKSTKTDEVTGGTDLYDCQFKVVTKENEPSVPWSELKGELEHTYRQAITHISYGKGASIQKRITASTLYNLEKGGGEVGFIAGKQDEQLKEEFNQEDMEKIMALYSMLKNAKATSSAPSSSEAKGTPQVSMPPPPSSMPSSTPSMPSVPSIPSGKTEVKEEKKPEQLPPKMDDLAKSVSGGAPSGGGMDFSGLDANAMAKLMAMMGK